MNWGSIPRLFTPDRIEYSLMSVSIHLQCNHGAREISIIPLFVDFHYFCIIPPFLQTPTPPLVE